MIPIIFTITLLLTSSTLLAQDEDWSAQIEQLKLVKDVGGLEDYHLGPGDVMSISVFGVDGFDHQLRVSSSGKVTIPFLGKVSVGGLTGEEIEENLAQLIRENGLIRNPQVSVFVTEYRSQPIYILGAVSQPGQYMITHQMNLIGAISMAGGLIPNRATDYALFQRQGPVLQVSDENAHGKDVLEGGDTQSEVIKIDLKDLLENGNLALNIPVQGGDVIHIPEKKVTLYYVVGQVNNPGAFEFPSNQDEEFFLTQALTRAGGPGRTAKTSKGMLVRRDLLGVRQELAVDFDAILKGTKPDIPILPNDVIFIPGSNAKTIGYGLLAIIPGTVNALIWSAAIR